MKNWRWKGNCGFVSSEKLLLGLDMQCCVCVGSISGAIRSFVVFCTEASG